MSVADKLITIANNTPLVCEKLYTEKTVSGNPIAVGDVSSVEHSLDVKLISDTITDFSGVKVSRYGKNLFDITTASEYSGAGTPKWEDNNVLAISQTAVTSMYISSNFIIPITESLVGKKITVSAKAKSNTGNEQACIRILYFNKSMAVNVSGMNIIAKTYSTEFVNISASGIILELPEDKTGHLCLSLYSNAEGTITNGATSYYKDIQIEINDTATEYEPYKEPQIATANSDGTVEGLTSLSPNMTLLADNTVNIECTYKSGSNPTANEKFIELQEAFANAKEIIQKYKIKMEK